MRESQYTYTQYAHTLAATNPRPVANSLRRRTATNERRIACITSIFARHNRADASALAARSTRARG